MWQQIVVYFIGVAVLVYVGISVWRLVTRRRDPCSGCAGCDLRTQLDKKATGCTEYRKNDGRGKGCCG